MRHSAFVALFVAILFAFPASAAPGAAASKAKGVRCGKKVCAAGQVCGNPSCGICGKPGTVFSDKECDKDSDDAATTKGKPSCKTWKCPAGQKCVTNGPAVLCVAASCAGVQCNSGMHCMMKAGRATCVEGAASSR
jgi:hypothetical protein